VAPPSYPPCRYGRVAPPSYPPCRYGHSLQRAVRKEFSGHLKWALYLLVQVMRGRSSTPSLVLLE
jgi:hypothetical protein